MRVSKMTLAWLLTAASTLCFAQTLERGAVHGTVYDASRAAVGGAKVTLSNPSTGFRREMQTTGDGGYDFEAVPPGEYTLVAEAPNFAVTTVKGIVVNVGAVTASRCKHATEVRSGIGDRECEHRGSGHSHRRHQPVARFQKPGESSLPRPRLS